MGGDVTLRNPQGRIAQNPKPELQHPKHMTLHAQCSIFIQALIRFLSQPVPAEMSPGSALKRALISLLLALAHQYDLVLNINRDSPDQQVKSAFRKVVLRAHPDKPGGSELCDGELNHDP